MHATYTELTTLHGTRNVSIHAKFSLRSMLRCTLRQMLRFIQDFKILHYSLRKTLRLMIHCTLRKAFDLRNTHISTTIIKLYESATKKANTGFIISL